MDARMPILLAAVAAMIVPSVAQAADPSGTWLTESKDSIIRIADCASSPTGAPPAVPAGKLCGFIAWLQDPEQAQKDGYSIGRKVVLDMVPSKPDRWDGEVLNTDDGKMYKGNMDLAADGKLKVSGCVMFICRGQTWVRQDLPTPAARTPGSAAAQPPRAR